MRKFETDYAGAWRGYCNTRESAIVAATRHLARDGYRRATISDRETGEVVCRVELGPDKRTIIITAVRIFRKIGL